MCWAHNAALRTCVLSIPIARGKKEFAPVSGVPEYSPMGPAYSALGERWLG